MVLDLLGLGGEPRQLGLHRVHAVERGGTPRRLHRGCAALHEFRAQRLEIGGELRQLGADIGQALRLVLREGGNRRHRQRRAEKKHPLHARVLRRRPQRRAPSRHGGSANSRPRRNRPRAGVPCHRTRSGAGCPRHRWRSCSP